MFDVIVIGAGVIGCGVARELSKYNLNICVLEKGSDVAVGTTKANSAIVHAGHDAKPGSLKSVLNKKGNAMFDRLSKELDFPFKRNGSLTLWTILSKLRILPLSKNIISQGDSIALCNFSKLFTAAIIGLICNFP